MAEQATKTGISPYNVCLMIVLKAPLCMFCIGCSDSDPYVQGTKLKRIAQLLPHDSEGTKSPCLHHMTIAYQADLYHFIMHKQFELMDSLCTHDSCRHVASTLTSQV